MTVRREIDEPCHEIGTRILEDPLHTRVVRWGFVGRARLPSGLS